MCVNVLWCVSIRKAIYKVVAEFCKAAQLSVFILGMQYLGLGVLKHVFGVQYAVYVLVKRKRANLGQTASPQGPQGPFTNLPNLRQCCGG